MPFWFFEEQGLTCRLNLFDDDAIIWKLVTGEDLSRAQPPYDPLTAWVTLAYVGGIEQGGPFLKPELDREQRLKIAREILSYDELVVVETIAVPRRFRKLPAPKLEEIVRTAPSYLDRMWAGCWLKLTGWTASADCSFSYTSDEFPLGELEENVINGYASSQGVIGQDDLLGWKRVGNSPECNLLLQRLNICDVHYRLNGPPPYEYMCDTIPGGPGWKQVVRLVPDTGNGIVSSTDGQYDPRSPIPARSPGRAAQTP